VTHRSTSTQQAVTRVARRPGRPKGSGLRTDRDRLLAAAIRAIREHGPEATMDHVAAEASVSKPIVYRTVGDKAAITIALSEWLIDQIASATGAAQAEVVEPRAQFRAATRAYLATIEEHRNVFLFVNRGEHSTDLFGRLVERSAHPLIEVFASVREQGHHDLGAARSWAYAIVGALQVAATMWQRDRFRDLDELADDLTRLVWDGLGDALTSG
jgi:AcrR family transcriptional regulator